MEIITKSDKETFDFAKKFTKDLKGGEVIGLIGDLGAGKTVFTKGLAAGLGVKENVNSPTFVLMKVYDIKKRTSKIKKLIHIDAYRITGTDDLLSIGITDYLNNPGCVVVIEWIDRLRDFKTKSHNIIINFVNDKQRKIVL